MTTINVINIFAMELSKLTYLFRLVSYLRLFTIKELTILACIAISLQSLLDLSESHINTRNIKIDFYLVTMPDSDTRRFESIIKHVLKHPDDESRTKVVNNSHIRLKEAAIEYGYWHGDMARIRMDAGATVSNLSGVEHTIDLDDDEGLGEHTAFLYHPTMKIIAVQRNRFAVSAGKIIRYFEIMGNVDSPIELDPIYTRDTLKRLANLKSARKFVIKMAGPINAAAFKKQVPGCGGMIDLINTFRSPFITVDMSMGHTRGSLNIQSVLDNARAFFRGIQRDDIDATKIEITGVTKSDERDILDLVEERMTVIAQVEQANDRMLPYNNRRAVLHEAMGMKRAEIRSILA